MRCRRRHTQSSPFSRSTCAPENSAVGVTRSASAAATASPASRKRPSANAIAARCSCFSCSRDIPAHAPSTRAETSTMQADRDCPALPAPVCRIPAGVPNPPAPRQPARNPTAGTSAARRRGRGADSPTPPNRSRSRSPAPPDASPSPACFPAMNPVRQRGKAPPAAPVPRRAHRPNHREHGQDRRTAPRMPPPTPRRSAAAWAGTHTAYVPAQPVFPHSVPAHRQSGIPASVRRPRPVPRQTACAPAGGQWRSGRSRSRSRPDTP